MRPRVHPIFIFLISIILVVTAIFAIRGCIISQDPNNITRRSANDNDITVESNLDLAGVGAQYKINPKADIDNLVVRVTFMDKNRDEVTYIVKSLGNVEKDEQVSFTVSIFDLGVEAIRIVYERVAVVGGIVIK